MRWLGFQWNGKVRWASDYFDALYDYAVELINKGLAYVDDLTPEQMREYRGTLTQPGKNSPNRDRSAKENLDLFTRMRNGEFADGAMVLRAKIDMTSPNINMRDPVIYRIKRAHHIRTGDKWCIYPMYDYTHCISDALEGITHSICTLEFEDHRPLYDWVLDNITIPCHPHQYEFSRLELHYTITSKRKLLQLVTEKHVSGWDDPRMPTIQRHAPPRLHAGRHPRIRQAHRRVQEREHRRHGDHGRRDPRRPGIARAARDGGHQSAQGDHHQLRRCPDARSGFSSQSCPNWANASSRSAKNCSSKPTILPKCRRPAGSVSCSAARYACATAM